MDENSLPHPENSRDSKPFRRALVIGLLVVPTLLTVTIGWFGANFSSDVSRSEPFGGDYLQEWIGGRIISCSQRANLYDPGTFKELQHDVALVGFQWPDGKYFPMVYPPFYYALVSPLSQLDYKFAALVWLGIMSMALGASGLFLWRMCDRRPWPLFLLFCCPVVTSLTTGQKGTLLLLIVVAAYWLLKKERAVSAGIVFGLIAFKPHLALPIGVVMLVCGQWKFCLGSLLSATVLVGICFIAGPDLCVGYTKVCLGMGDYVATGGYRLEQGFSIWSAWQMTLANPMHVKLATIGSAMVIFGGTIALARSRSTSVTTIFNIGIVATVLIAPHFYLYDLTLLILPAISMIIYEFRCAGMSNPIKATLLGSYALLLFATPMLVGATASSGLPLGSSMVVLIWAASILAYALPESSLNRVESTLAAGRSSS